jgi:hypothetical protein
LVGFVITVLRVWWGVVIRFGVLWCACVGLVCGTLVLV